MTSLVIAISLTSIKTSMSPRNFSTITLARNTFTYHSLSNLRIHHITPFITDLDFASHPERCPCYSKYTDLFPPRPSHIPKYPPTTASPPAGRAATPSPTHAPRNPRLSGGLPLHPRNEQIRSRPPGESGHGARESVTPSRASSPELSVPSVRAQPTLTPRNTFAGEDEEVDGGGGDVGRGTAREVRFDEGLEEDERGWFDADEDADDENSGTRSAETVSLAPSSSTPSEAAFDPEASWPFYTQQTLATRRMSYPRSSSMPPMHATSASEPNPSTSPPPSLESSISNPGQKKRARFDDDSITSDLVLRRNSIGPSHLRHSSAPPASPSRNESYSSLVALHGSEQGQAHGRGERISEQDRESMAEAAAAVGIFQEVVDELIDAAEENRENYDQLNRFADEVRQTILENFEDEANGSQIEEGHSDDDPDTVRRSAALDRTATDHDIGLELVRAAGRLHIREPSLADDDVDESVAAWADDTSSPSTPSDSDTERLRPEKASSRLLHCASEPELKSPPLSPVPEEESESSTETVRITRPASPDADFRRRISDSQAQHTSLISEQHGEMKRRRASMTDFRAVKGILRVPEKASPAGVVMTACSVGPSDSGRLRSVPEDPVLHSRTGTPDRQSTKTAQTVRSETGLLQLLWEEPSSSSADSSSDSSSHPGALQIPTRAKSKSKTECASKSHPPSPSHERSGASSPMEKVKKWARENGGDPGAEGDDVPELRLPLLVISGHPSHTQTPSHPHSPRHEYPLAPPNTEKSSAVPSARATRHPSEQISSSSEAKASSSHGNVDDSEEDEPLELRVRPTFSRPGADSKRSKHLLASPDYLTVPAHQRSPHATASSPPSPCSGSRNTKKHVQAISRQLSNLAAEDAHFRTHRDSLELMRYHELARESGQTGRVNQALMGTRDSFLITKARRTGDKEKGDVLGTIEDASPPASVFLLPLPGKKRAGKGSKSETAAVAVTPAASAPAIVNSGRREVDKGGKGGAPLAGEGWGDRHPDEHRHCPIYEVERPAWYESRFGRGKLGGKTVV